MSIYDAHHCSTKFSFTSVSNCTNALISPGVSCWRPCKILICSPTLVPNIPDPNPNFTGDGCVNGKLSCEKCSGDDGGDR